MECEDVLATGLLDALRQRKKEFKERTELADLVQNKLRLSLPGVHVSREDGLDNCLIKVKGNFIAFTACGICALTTDDARYTAHIQFLDIEKLVRHIVELVQE